MNSKIKVSVGNNKLGNIPNISLPPIKTCKKDAPCIKDCYALAAYKRWKNVKNAWDNNLKILKEDIEVYFNQTSDFLKQEPDFFRWHVGGDIINQQYLNHMKKLAIEFPTTKFLAFTKMYHLNYSQLPHNLSIILSIWPQYEFTNKYNLPLAFMQDGTETRVFNTIECNKSCDECHSCWSLKLINKNVVLSKH